MFRAYRFRFDPVFDSRHNLFALYELSKFAAVVPTELVKEFGEYVGLVGVLWSNNHRFRSEKALRAFFKRTQLDRSVSKGDFLKELTRRLVHAATQVVNLGAQRYDKSP